MNWDVIWLPAAEDELADIWMAATDRPGITRASSQIDRQLERDPQTAGESREDGRRILFEPPLGVIYRIILDDRRVEVVHVWRFRT